MYSTPSLLPSPFDSIRDAVLTVSPNKQYLGILRPTTPATTEPNVQQNSKYKNTIKNRCHVFLKVGSIERETIIALHLCVDLCAA